MSSSGRRPAPDSQPFTVRTEEQQYWGGAHEREAAEEERSRLLNIEDHAVTVAYRSVGLQAGLSPSAYGMNDSTEFPQSTREHLLSTKRKAQQEELEGVGSQARGSTIDRLQDFNQQFPSVRPGSVRSPPEQVSRNPTAREAHNHV